MKKSKIVLLNFFYFKNQQQKKTKKLKSIKSNLLFNIVYLVFFTL
jgi:hypothetical protein